MQRYRLDLVTAPTIEPVTLTEAKDYMRVTSTDDDSLITSLIVVARTGAESFTRRAFITQTWNMLMDNWPASKNNIWWDGVRQLPVSALSGKPRIEVPKAPLISVTHIKTYDDADAATTFASSNYFVSPYSGEFAAKGRIALRDGSSWPTFTRGPDGIEIQFIAGYGATAADVPSQIKQALLLEVNELYENRGACGGDICCSIAKKLLKPFRLLTVAGC